MNRSTFGVVMIVAAMGFGLAGCHTTPQSDEKRQALELWSQHLLSLDLSASRVVTLRA